MDKLALAEEVLVRLQRGENPDGFAEDLDAFLKDPACWRKTASGLAVPETDEQVWMQNVYREIGIDCVVPPVPALTRRQTKSLEQFGFRLFFIPAITEEAYSALFGKPDWGDHLDISRIERRPLPGKWVAVETIDKPYWLSPEGYPNDRLAAAVKLKRRFGVSWDDLHDGGLLERIAKATGFPRKTTRLPTAEEWTFLANLFRKLVPLRGEVLPDLGATDSWEWCGNTYGSDGSDYRLLMGDHTFGGLAKVRDCRDDLLAFRVLAVL